MPHFVARDGQRLSLTIVGRGTPVLVLSGLGVGGRLWLPYVASLLHRRKFYLLDLRGQARSAAIPFNQPDVFQNHAEDAQDLIRQLGLRDHYIIGYSLGASVALHLQRIGGFAGARRYLHIDQSPCVRNRAGWPHGLGGERQAEVLGRFSRLVALLDRHVGIERLRDLPQAAWSEFVSLLFGLGRAGSIAAAVLRRFRPLAHILPINRVAALRAYLGNYTGDGHDYRESLQACPVPVTVMVAMRSSFYPPAGQIAIADYVRDCQIVRMERSGHMPLLDEPLRFSRELRRFLSA